MLSRISRTSSWFKILFTAVYFILFAVQLHLKYSIALSRNLALDVDAMAAASYHPPAYEHKQQLRKEFVGDKLNVKVSKRYQHKTCYECLFVAFNEIIPPPVITQRIALTTTGRSHAAPILYLHRGPPATC
jgi:hypothetical protein